MWTWRDASHILLSIGKSWRPNKNAASLLALDIPVSVGCALDRESFTPHPTPGGSSAQPGVQIPTLWLRELSPSWSKCRTRTVLSLSPACCFGADQESIALCSLAAPCFSPFLRLRPANHLQLPVLPFFVINVFWEKQPVLSTLISLSPNTSCYPAHCSLCLSAWEFQIQWTIPTLCDTAV